MANSIQKAVSGQTPLAKQQKSVNAMMNSILDGEGMRKRFNDLLGERTPQFLSSVVSLVRRHSMRPR